MAANGAVAAGMVSAGWRRIAGWRDPDRAAARAAVREAETIAFYASLGLDDQARPRPTALAPD
jgi:hypothetical protein